MAHASLRRPRVWPWRAMRWPLQKPASCLGQQHLFFLDLLTLFLSGQAYKHIFTSPSSVEKEVKATRSGNARIHGMTRVTTASLAYIATQVCSVASSLHQCDTYQLVAPFCTVVFLCLLQDWHRHRLGTLLPKRFRLFRSSWRKGLCQRTAGLVELVGFPSVSFQRLMF